MVKHLVKKALAALIVAVVATLPQSLMAAEMGANDSVYSKSSDGYLNIRQQPTVKSPVIGQLFTGSTGARNMGKVDNWYIVMLDGKTGYVHANYAALKRQPLPGDRNRKVFMVVMQSFPSRAEAIKGAEAFMQDWLPHVIYKGYANGKATYRLCIGSFYSKQRAEAFIKQTEKTLGSTNILWIWETKGMPECIYCPKSLNDETYDTPLIAQ